LAGEGGGGGHGDRPFTTTRRVSPPLPLILRCPPWRASKEGSSSLSEVGVKQGDLERMATDAMKQTRLLVNNPREVTYDDAYAIYAGALGEVRPAA